MAENECSDFNVISSDTHSDTYNDHYIDYWNGHWNQRINTVICVNSSYNGIILHHHHQPNRRVHFDTCHVEFRAHEPKMDLIITKRKSICDYFIEIFYL